MQGLKFRIQHPDGRLEELQIEGDRALIGSGAHCDIRLPVDQSAVESIAIQSGSTGVVADARSFQPAPTINESPFTRTQVMQDSVLGVGQTRIWVTLSELSEGAVAKKKQEKTSPFTYVLAAIAVPICAYILLTGNGDASQSRMPTKIPALWSKAPPTCPQSSPEAAAALADDRAGLAEAKQERRPFHVQDGVAAVPLFQEAAACYRVAGKPKLAAEYAQHAEELRKDVAEDFRTHRVRLEHAISVKDWATAQEEVRVLLAFTQGQQGDYVTWLSNLDRRLELTYGSKHQ
jgi:hypothetical protein